MAFLCPARIRKEWKKRVQANARPRDKPAALGRITGSASMDTLVRVAMEKNNGGRKSVMMVLYDFIPCVDDELGVKRGDRVRVLYKENEEWAYAIRDDGVEGFVPTNYLASPAELSRRNMLGDDGTCDCRRYDEKHQPNIDAMTNKMSSLTFTSTKADTNISSDSSDVMLHTNRACSTSDTTDSHKPVANHIARLEAYIGSTTRRNKDARKRQASSWVPEISTSENGTTSGVYTDSDSPGSRTDSSSLHGASPSTRRPAEQKRITFKVVSDSDSGCETTAKSPQQTRSPETKTVLVSADTQFSTNIETFEKLPLGNYLVMFNFDGNQENDLTVSSGELVTVLNMDDPDWYWVATRDNDEGFVPSGYLCNVKGSEIVQQDFDSYNADDSALTDDCYIPEPGHIFTSTPVKPSMNRRPMPTKMLILFDYEAKQYDDISVTKGEYVYVDMDNQRFLDWIWVYSPVTQKEGFLPREYVKPPKGTGIPSTEL